MFIILLMLLMLLMVIADDHKFYINKLASIVIKLTTL